MEQKPCVFCQIVRGAIPSKIVYEDDLVIAFLDIAPRSKAMTIVAPKQHYNKFDENFDLSLKTFFSALIVAEMIKQALQPKEINFSIIRSEAVPHFHIRIYPIFEKEVPLLEGEPVYTNEFELESLAQKIRSVKIELKKEEKVEEKKEEEPRTEEEIYHIRRSLELA
ncbi:MAG: HIT domain-containing protein [Candidatus Aenigmarchaeota archaeon]|nr:HIT domain-containing protein [Candidatus Aenigmarchaeota archaeon]